MFEPKSAEHRIDLLEFEAHMQEWEKNNVGFIIVQRQLDQEPHEIQQRLEKTQMKEKETRRNLMVLQ